MLKGEVKLVCELARQIAKEEIAAMDKSLETKITDLQAEIKKVRELKIEAKKPEKSVNSGFSRK